jgi:hypothetical protein
MYTFETGGGNEPKTFTLEFTGKETSSSEKLLQLTKVDEGKCEDETRISSFVWHFLLHNESLKSHIRQICSCPWGEDCALRTLYQVVTNNPILPYLDIPMDPIRI